MLKNFNKKMATSVSVTWVHKCWSIWIVTTLGHHEPINIINIPKVTAKVDDSVSVSCVEICCSSSRSGIASIIFHFKTASIARQASKQKLLFISTCILWFKSWWPCCLSLSSRHGNVLPLNANLGVFQGPLNFCWKQFAVINSLTWHTQLESQSWNSQMQIRISM